MPSKIPAINPGAACSVPGLQSHSAEPSVVRRVQPWLSPAKAGTQVWGDGHGTPALFHIIHSLQTTDLSPEVGEPVSVSQSHWSVVIPTNTVCEEFNPTSDIDIQMAVFLKLLNLIPSDAKLPFQGDLESLHRNLASYGPLPCPFHLMSEGIHSLTLTELLLEMKRYSKTRRGKRSISFPFLLRCY